VSFEARGELVGLVEDLGNGAGHWHHTWYLGRASMAWTITRR
jgi:hypothetical protein